MPILSNCQGTKRIRENPGYSFSYSCIDSSTRSNARIMSAFALLPLISPRFKASKDAIISIYCLFASCSNLSHFILSPLYFNITRPKKSENNRPESNRAQCSKVVRLNTAKITLPSGSKYHFPVIPAINDADTIRIR